MIGALLKGVACEKNRRLYSLPGSRRSPVASGPGTCRSALGTTLSATRGTKEHEEGFEAAKAATQERPEDSEESDAAMEKATPQ
jgi:hypothetical protein